MEKKYLDLVIQRIKDLPTLPLIAQSIIGITEDPKSCINDLTRIISKDPSLTSRVLRLVNSAFYGFPKKIDTLSQAIVILGFNTIRSLAFSISIFDAFNKIQIETTREYFNKLWEHSIGVASCAYLISNKTNQKIKEQAYVGGLIHDIGIIILEQLFYQDFIDTLTYANTKKITFYDAEKEKIGITHSEIGGMLAEKWNFPEVLRDVIIYHHDVPIGINNYEIIATVYASDIICKLRGIGFTGDIKAIKYKDIKPEIKELLKLTQEQPIDLYNEITEQLTNISTSYQIISGEEVFPPLKNKKIPHSRKKILVVDDDSIIREIVKDIFTQAGFTIYEAEDGEMALEKIKESKFDLILLDIYMPKMDGLEVLKAIKEDPKSSSIPVIMLTIRGEKDTVIKAKELGCSAYVTKPFSSSVLLTKAYSLLNAK